MKKKLLTVSLVIALAAIAIIGGTMAYFTDTDDADNTFAVGSVEIQLIEQQRSEDASSLETFQNGKTLLPVVGLEESGVETVGGVSGLPKAENYVDKIITVQNIGKSDAYLRVFVAIPSMLDANGILTLDHTDASKADGEWAEEELVAQNVEVQGVSCNIYSRIYTSPVAPEAVTSTPAYIGFYMDASVDINEDGQYTITRDGGTEVIEYDASADVNIPVFAQGIQADGFASAQEAFAASDLPENPWAAP